MASLVASPRRLLLMGGLCLVVAVAVLFWFRDGGADVVEESGDGWKTIEFEGVRVEIPADWERSDQDGCEFRFEVWTPSQESECAWSGGVAFYGSATFDTDVGPGLRRGDVRDDEPRWGGYAYAGDYAVYVGDDNRSVVKRVLASAR